jgi:nucleotide-binding universal stress UspA family protein
MIETVLIPVDGSGAARRAVEFGTDLAKRYGARVVLLHVLVHQNLADALRGLSDVERTAGGGLAGLAGALGDLPLDSIVSADETGPHPSREILDFIAERVIEIAEKIAKANGVASVTSAVEDGDPARRILEYAEKENASVIVMGSRGLSDVEGLLLGSVSHKVSHLAQCTCITVR